MEIYIVDCSCTIRKVFRTLRNTKHKLKRGSVPGDTVIENLLMFSILYCKCRQIFSTVKLGKKILRGKIEQGFLGKDTGLQGYS